MAEVLFILSNLFAGYITFSAAHMALGKSENWRIAVASLAGLPVIIVITMLLLGSIGLLTPAYTTMLLGVVALALFGVRLKKKSTSKTAPTSNKYNWLEMISMALFILPLGILLVHACFFGIDYSYDDLSYHATAVSHWILDERLSLPPVGYHAYFPFNGELLNLWFMLPFGNDTMVGMNNFLCGTIGAVAIIALCLALRVGTCSSFLIGAAILVSEPFYRSATLFSMSDFIGPVMILSAFVMATPSATGTTNRNRIVDVIYCGLFIGIAVGSKASMIVAPVFFLLWMFLMVIKKSIRLTEPMAFIFCVILTGGYFYIRNWILTGNPFFPAEIGPFNGPLIAEYQTKTKLITRILANYNNLAVWKVLLEGYTSWPVSLFVLSLLGYVCFIWTFLNKLFHRQKLPEYLNLMIFLVGFTMIIQYPFTPFSGTTNVCNGQIVTFKRYVICPFLMGLVLFAMLLKQQNSQQWLARDSQLTKKTILLWQTIFIVCVIWAIARFVYFKGSFACFWGGAVLFMTWIGIYYLRLSRLSINYRVLYSFIAVIFLLGISLYSPRTHENITKQVFRRITSAYTCPTMFKAWQFLEQLPDNSTILPLGTARHIPYPLYGRRLQLRPVFLNNRPMHIYWKDEGTLWNGWSENCSNKNKLPTGPRSNYRNLLQLVEKETVDYVMLSKRRDKDWHPILKYLKKSSAMELIFSDSCSMIWNLSPARINTDPK